MAQGKVKPVVWSKIAANQYFEILTYLSLNAPEALQLVGNSILELIESLDKTYNNFPADRFKKNNNGQFKAAVIFSYRISYQITEHTIFILRIRHTSREPKTL